ncbi:hypothetical protein P775_09300 [Puniceibacterium antarcticum]|uniref:MobA-like NTP transferase domain-containing protein n=1 Tax=Puniceibacterium antarcticum TaxID=1206336 RepID=A0A2G8RGS6_9RHOB|nr:nucleotidyltransferase family protein [Puniceibacterium antarcticum]PIL20712.1 hypothetical protein P775_09300 [Puniceibacterium antarcticum]
MTVTILIPAAGFGTRMRGADKLLQVVDDIPLLRRLALRALAATPHVVVTLPNLDGERAQAIANLDLQIVLVPDAETGMTASLRRGAAHILKGSALMIVPADMPDLTTSDLLRMIRAFEDSPEPTLQQGTAEDGTPGHPVVFPPDCLAAFADLTGDQGAREILRANKNRLQPVPLPAKNALTDLDTPEAWDLWRASQCHD